MEKITYYLLCISVLATIFLLINATTANAVSINIITQNSTENIKLDLDQFLKRKLSTIENGKVKIDIGSVQGSPIESALLYLCKDKNIVDCLSTLPISFGTKVDTLLKQQDIEINGKSGIASIIKTNQSWLADWIGIENGLVQNSDPGEIDVYSSVNSNDTKNFIQTYGMIPVSFMQKVDFKGKKIYQATGIAQKKGSIENISLVNSKLNSELQKDDGYIFAFPVDGRIYSPITFYNVPRRCGDSVCSIGENYQTCWYDCTCPDGQIAGRAGCTKKTEARLIIDEIDPEKIPCVIAGLEFGPNATCQPTLLDLKFHIVNAPVNYSISSGSFYFEMNNGNETQPQTYKPICTPQNLAQYGLSISDLTRPPTYNVSDYECSMELPELTNIRSKSEARTLFMGMYMNVLTSNGTESIEITNSTSLEINALGADFSELRDVQDIVKSAKRTLRTLQDVTATITWISFAISVYLTIITVYCVGTSIVTLGALTGACAVGITLLSIILNIVLLLLNLAKIALRLCQGEPLSTGEVVGVVGSFLGILLGGIAYTDLVSQVSTLYNVLTVVQLILQVGSLASIPAAPSYIDGGRFKGFDPYSKAPPIMSEGAAGKASLAMRQVGSACGKQKKTLDYARQKIGQIEAKKEIEFKKATANLIFARGSVTGQSDKVCADENVKAFYNFEAFGCQDLWFGFNNDTRPLCDFSSQKWQTNRDNRIFGPTCNQTNTTSYYWVNRNETDNKQLGYRVYNTTGINQLFNANASKLFDTQEENAPLDIFVTCDPGPGSEKIQDQFRFLNYTENCG